MKAAATEHQGTLYLCAVLSQATYSGRTGHQQPKVNANPYGIRMVSEVFLHHYLCATAMFLAEHEADCSVS